jgi:DNA-binding NtrC family response regulator
MKSILFVDDETKLLRILASYFRKKGFTVYTASTGEEARSRLRDTDAQIIFLDLKLPDTTGIQLLQEFVPLYPNKLFVIMTAYSDVESAVTAMKAGAFDYVSKPAKMDEMEIILQRACQWLDIKQENRTLKEKISKILQDQEMIGVSPAMKRVFRMAERAAETDATVLLEGESGTGKSRIARMIHRWSDRKDRPFVSVNCAALPEQLLESELFGYEKGAFTGAHTKRQGKFEAARNGTIFLDEIGEISLPLQAKLLQVVQEKSFMPLGSNRMVHVNVRIIAATNRDLKTMVEEGLFREDLYYRLNIIDIFIPPLRERKEDIPPLIRRFLEKQRAKYNKSFTLSPELIDRLVKYPWPGNVRELENAVERAVVLCRNEQLSIEDFPREIHQTETPGPPSDIALDPTKSLPEQLEAIEKKLILDALAQTGGQIAAAARLLSISRQRLMYKMNKYAIR